MALDHAAFLMQQLPRQRTRLAHYEYGGETVWLKRASPPRSGGRRRLLATVARLAHLPALRPLPRTDGAAAIATEAARLHSFTTHGLRVPQVLAECADGLLMHDLGEPTQPAAPLVNEIEAAIAAGSRPVLALWQQGLALLDAVHAQGLCLSHASAHHMVRCPDGTLACVDLDDDPAAHLPLPTCQVRDALAYLHSTAWLLHAAGARELAREPWNVWLQNPVRSATFRETLATTAAGLTWLRYLPPDDRWGHEAYRLRAMYEQLVALRYE